MGKRRLIGKIVILMLGLAAVVMLAASRRTIPASAPEKRYRIVIDPGHGGGDCGAVGVSGVKEAGLNLAVSLYLKEELEALEMEAILTRSGEGALAEGKRADMAARARIMNGDGVDLGVDVHKQVRRSIGAWADGVLHEGQRRGRAARKDRYRQHNRRAGGGTAHSQSRGLLCDKGEQAGGGAGGVRLSLKQRR